MTGASGTIFVVDDDEAVRKSISRLLVASGLSVQAFASAEQFLTERDHTLTGCLLVDIRMPGMNGFSLVEELADRNQTLPFIVISGHGGAEAKLRAQQAGAIAFLRKPVETESLLKAIRQALP